MDTKSFITQKSLFIIGALLFVIIVAGSFTILQKKGGIKALFSQAAIIPQPVPTLNQTITYIYGCREITKSGNYILSQNIIVPVNSTCFNIHDTNDVTLDCQGKNLSINGTGVVQEVNIVTFTKVNRYTMKSCNLSLQNYRTGLPLNGVVATNSPNGTLTGNTIGAMALKFNSGSHNSQLSNNTFDGKIEFRDANNALVQSNVFKNTRLIGLDANLLFVNGIGNKILDNTFDGGSDGAVGSRSGADEAILVVNQTSSLIQNNSIVNIWDCGIESTDDFYSSTISNNRIANAGVCGIGGWINSSWKGNVVSGNTVDRAPKLFYFYVTDVSINRSTIYFKDNQFSSNSLTNQKRITNGAAEFPSYFWIPSGGYGDTVFKHGNNRFTSNNFGKITLSPFFDPYSMVVDGGGNSCIISSDPLYPIRCQ